MLNVNEVRQQARAIWLTMMQRFGSEIQGNRGDCTFAFEIHTRNVTYDKILERQSKTEVRQLLLDENLEIFFLYRHYIQLILH
jgi:hypothetical protein